eukprot:g491.t1
MLGKGGPKKMQRKTLGKRPWTAQENKLLKALVDKHGPKKWSKIATMMEGRVGKQCRERWHNHLSPFVCKDAWTEHEDRLIFNNQKEKGNQWAQLAQMLPGRTDNAIKNRFYSTIRRLNRQAQTDCVIRMCLERNEITVEQFLEVNRKAALRLKRIANSSKKRRHNVLRSGKRGRASSKSKSGKAAAKAESKSVHSSPTIPKRAKGKKKRKRKTNARADKTDSHDDNVSRYTSRRTSLAPLKTKTKCPSSYLLTAIGARRPALSALNDTAISTSSTRHRGDYDFDKSMLSFLRSDERRDRLRRGHQQRSVVDEPTKLSRSRSDPGSSGPPPLPKEIMSSFGQDVSRELDAVTSTLSPKFSATEVASDARFPDKTFVLDTSPRAVSLFPFYEIGGNKTIDEVDSDGEMGKILLPNPLVGSYYGISISK